MKRIFLASLILAATGMVILTGCLKDKGFENNEYGINDPDTQPPGVGFPLGAKAKNGYGLDVSGTAQIVNDMVYVNLESGSPAPADIVITLENKSTEMVAAYNTANTTTIQVMPTSLYSVPLTVTIKAGTRNAQVPLSISSTLTLDPNKSYGVGLRIASVNGNYVIAGNMKDLFIDFTIKNKYDGKYNLRGYHNRTIPDYSAPYNVTVWMITTGPNSVSMYWPAVSAYAHPILGGASYYSSFTTNLYFDLVTNNLLSWDMIPYPFGVSSAQVYAGRYNPTTKIIYSHIGYNANPLRMFFDTLTYLGAR